MSFTFPENDDLVSEPCHSGEIEIKMKYFREIRGTRMLIRTVSESDKGQDMFFFLGFFLK